MIQAKNLENPSVLDVHDVCFRRDGQLILNNVSFSVQPGQHWALIGPNGAGKSTLLNMCGALSHPTSGSVEVLGQRLGKVELQSLRQHIGHVDPRHNPAPHTTIKQVILSGITGSVALPNRWTPTSQNLGAAAELAAMLGLSKRQESRWATLSQGERSRALIARALICTPELLLLDEPSTGLDVAARENLLQTVTRLAANYPGLATVTVTHHLEELPPNTTHAMLLRQGSVVSLGPIKEVLTTSLVSKSFDYPIEVTENRGRWAARAATQQEMRLQ